MDCDQSASIVEQIYASHCVFSDEEKLRRKFHFFYKIQMFRSHFSIT